MATLWEWKDEPQTLSVIVVLHIAILYIGVLAGLTMLTHLAQFIGISFRTYAYLGIAVSLLISGAVVASGIRRLKVIHLADTSSLLAILLVRGIGAGLAISLHRVGRISPDEYYSAVNPVFYTSIPLKR